MGDRDRIRASYDAMAPAYARKFRDELAHKPLDRALLDHLAGEARGGRVLEVGCGPGQVAAYLHKRGAQVAGLDSSPAMIGQARREHPGIPFTVGDFFAIPEPDGAFAAVVAFYAIVHTEPDELPRLFREWFRVLAPGGWLLMSFHVGDERLHVDEWEGAAVSLDFIFFAIEPVENALLDAGFTNEMRLVRTPYPDVEHPSRRAYLLAQKP
jgi:SAM-dependent methyltransferase